MKNNTFGYIAVVLLLSITGIFSLNLYFQQRDSQDKLDIGTFPLVLGEWQGREIKLADDEYKILETRNLILREYANPQGEKLSLFIVYSETNRAVFHPPEVCLIGSGVSIVGKETEEINYDKDIFFVNKLNLEKNGHKEIALYCYKAGKLYTDNYYLQQTHFTFNQLLGRQKGGATIRVSMSIREDEKYSLMALKSFIAKVIEIINTMYLDLGTML